MGLCESCCCKEEIIRLEVSLTVFNILLFYFNPSLFKQDIDEKLPVFQVTEVHQKFTNKSGFEKKFIWLSLKTKTIHMSTYENKERRHKEANLNDITTIVSGAPQLFKADEQVNVNANELSCRSLTVNFKRGGGIDIMFANESDRDLWFHTLRKIVTCLMKLEENKEQKFVDDRTPIFQ